MIWFFLYFLGVSLMIILMVACLIAMVVSLEYCDKDDLIVAALVLFVASLCGAGLATAYKYGPPQDSPPAIVQPEKTK